MFNQQEVQILLGGVNSPVDLEDLRKHTHYGGLYDDSQATITAFWNVCNFARAMDRVLFFFSNVVVVSPPQVVDSFDQEQRRALLRFVTSCSRPPLL